jgi:hypothetical protein
MGDMGDMGAGDWHTQARCDFPTFTTEI